MKKIKRPEEKCETTKKKNTSWGWIKISENGNWFNNSDSEPSTDKHYDDWQFSKRGKDEVW